MENMEITNKLESTYSGKRVFITGHTGFKGSWLVKMLSDLGAIIKGYALEPSSEINLFTEIGGERLCESVIGDLRNKSLLTNELLDFKPNFIFHLAAQPLVRLSYQIPLETFEVNAIGTANLLDAARLLESKCEIILITTDKVYHNYEWIYPYRESDRLGGYDPYSASKACCELVIDSYKNSFFNPSNYGDHQKSIAVARAGNVIGGGDWSLDRLVPDIIRQLSKGCDIEIRNPNSIRPWQHVVEPLFGYMQLGVMLTSNPLLYSNAYNFGPSSTDVLSVEEVVLKAIKFWGTGNYKKDLNKNNPHEAGVLKLDISKALDELNWKPILDSSESIERTIKWYKNYNNGHSAIDLMKTDIDFYLNKLYLKPQL